MTYEQVKALKAKEFKRLCGKKKRHTLKSQLVVDQANHEIICTAYGKGREYDFHLFKNSQVRLKSETECLADKGNQT